MPELAGPSSRKALFLQAQGKLVIVAPRFNNVGRRHRTG